MSSRKNTWLVTYCDMVTLLMAFFICLLTFSSVASSHKQGHLGRDAVVWRPRFSQTRTDEAAARMESLYREPGQGTTDTILETLENATGAASTENFVIRLPLNLLFDHDEHLSASGRRLLHALADNLRGMPWDLQFQVRAASATPRAVQLCHFLMFEEGYEPARLATGIEPRRGEGDFVWLVLFRPY